MVKTEGKPDSKNQMLDLRCVVTHSFRNKKGKLKRFHVTAKQQCDSKRITWMSQREIWNKRREKAITILCEFLTACHMQGTGSIDKSQKENLW